MDSNKYSAKRLADSILAVFIFFKGGGGGAWG